MKTIIILIKRFILTHIFELINFICYGDLPTSYYLKRGMHIGCNFYRQTSTKFDPSHCFLIKIGDNVTVANNVQFLAHDQSTRVYLGYGKVGKIEIGNNVFIGAKALILPNVTIGDNVIIGAGSIVTKCIPANSVAVGSPAKVIGNTDEYISKCESQILTAQKFDRSYINNKRLSDSKKEEIFNACKEGFAYIELGKVIDYGKRKLYKKHSKEDNKFQERDYIYILKAIALFSIVSAHVGLISNNTCLSILFSLLLSSIGSIGVGVFFLLSGYLYFNSNKPFSQFLKSKIRTIIIPWLFCGTLLFFYVALRKGGINFYNWFITITVHSHLYYLTILIIFYLVFWKLKNNLIFLYLNIILSIVSIILTGLDLIHIYPYINPFNWSIYFIVGVLIKKYNLLEKLAFFCKKWILTITSTFALILIIYLMNGVAISYWKYASIIVELIAMAFVFGGSYYLILKKVNWLIYIGKVSFSIYLLHMPVAGILTNLFNRFQLWYFTLFVPILIIIITIVGIQICRYISKKIKIDKIVDILIGFH